MSNSQIPPQLRSALAMFVKELENHIEFLKLIASVPPEQLSEAQDSKDIQNRFHLIKGAASFFQLTEITNCAKAGEQLFTTPYDTPTPLEQTTIELNSIVKRLQSEAAELTEKFENIGG